MTTEQYTTAKFKFWIPRVVSEHFKISLPPIIRGINTDEEITDKALEEAVEVCAYLELRFNGPKVFRLYMKSIGKLKPLLQELESVLLIRMRKEPGTTTFASTQEYESEFIGTLHLN